MRAPSPSLGLGPFRSGGFTSPRSPGSSWLGWSWTGLGLALGFYAVRMFGLTAGYHRYFSHRSFKTSRVVPVRARAARDAGRAEGAAVVGRASPRAPQVFRHARRHPLGAAARLLVGARQVDPRRRLRGDRLGPHQGLARTTPSCGGSTATTLVPPVGAGGAAGSRSAGCGRSCGASSSRRRCCGTARSASTRSRTCGAPPLRRPRDDSRNNFLLALITLGRGLAQQPPPLPALRAPGLLLVGDRHHALRAHGARRWVGLVWDLHGRRPTSATRATSSSRAKLPSAPAASASGADRLCRSEPIAGGSEPFEGYRIRSSILPGRCAR